MRINPLLSGKKLTVNLEGEFLSREFPTREEALLIYKRMLNGRTSGETKEELKALLANVREKFLD
jgi:hypothetical protein